MAKTVDQYLEDEKKLDTERNYWKNIWQLTAEYVHQRRADFTSSRQPGSFINSHLWTDEPVHIAETSASAFLGYIWSSGVDSFRLLGSKKVFGEDKEMAEFWSKVDEAMKEEMRDNAAGLSTALDESMLDLITMGTDAILVEERNIEDPQLGCLSFQPWTIQEFSAAEDPSGRAVKFNRRREYTVFQMVEKFGLDNISKKTRELYEKGSTNEKIVVLHVIEPRDKKDIVEGSLAAKDMPYASVHIEVEQKHICKNSGYQELPVACARLAKRSNETYGRGRGMNALPSIMMLNQVYEDYSLALEKNLDPPMYQINDAVTGNGYIDTSAGAINILKMDKSMPNVNPTGKLFDIQNINNVVEIIDRLIQSISNHFMIDRLINMNNDTQMTKGEAFLRNAIRQSTLRSIVSRILLEKFDVLINSSFLICLRRNKFGYMPGDPAAAAMEQNGQEVDYLPQKFVDAMQTNEQLYKIEYLTPAARDMMAEEGQGMVETLQIAGELAGWDEEVKHHVDISFALRRFSEIKGVDPQIWRKQKDAEKSINEERERQAEAQQMAMAQATAGVAKDSAIAQNNNQP